MNDFAAENEYVSRTILKTKVLSFHLWERRFKAEVAVDIKLPSTLEPIWRDFESNYVSKNLKKKLRLLPLSSTVVLAATIGGKYVTIRCNVVHCCIIMSLAEHPRSV
jgi:hypothetical protein